MNEKSIFDGHTDLLGNKKEIWMIHNVESFAEWFRRQDVPTKIRIENVTVRNRNSGSLPHKEREYLKKNRTLPPAAEITFEEMYEAWDHVITTHFRAELRSGRLDSAVGAGRLSAADALHLQELRS